MPLFLRRGYCFLLRSDDGRAGIPFDRSNLLPGAAKINAVRTRTHVGTENQSLRDTV